MAASENAEQSDSRLGRKNRGRSLRTCEVGKVRLTFSLVGGRTAMQSTLEAHTAGTSSLRVRAPPSVSAR